MAAKLDLWKLSADFRFLYKHGTLDKLEYAEEQGVDVPEIYYLLGNIYNDPMHVDNKSNKLITQTLHSRMENNTIRGMIKNVKDNVVWCKMRDSSKTTRCEG